ncbi:hypothetical protein TNCV_814051 [Trichonephila clavipes]|nr:hypothetical protein TNCV_814051 [Trichonephila clavipes]
MLRLVAAGDEGGCPPPAGEIRPRLCGEKALNAIALLPEPLGTGPDGVTSHEGQDLLGPTQYTRPWALRCMSRCSGYTRAFGDGPRNCEPWSSDEDDTGAGTLSPNYHTNGRTFELSTDLTYIAPLHGGSSAALGSNLWHAGHESGTLTIRLPRPRIFSGTRAYDMLDKSLAMIT